MFTSSKIQSILKTQAKSESSNPFSERQILAKIVMFALATIGKEPLGEEYTERMCVVVRGPLRDKIAEFETAESFMSTCFKSMMTVSQNQNKFKIVTAIFDTGAAPDLSWKDFMPTTWLKRVQPISADIGAAGDKTFSVEGVVERQVKIGEHVTTEDVGVALKSYTKMNFCSAFTQKN